MNEFVTREQTAERYLDSEIAVDLPYRDVVLANLLELDPDENAPCAELGDKEPLLDLGLISLLQVKRTATAIKARFGDKIQDRGPEFHDVDIILEGLRLHIREHHGDWLPRMGLNRHAETIGGLPHIGTGGQDYPTSLLETLELPSVSEPDGQDGQGVRVGVIDSVMFRNPQLADRFYVLESASLLPDGLPKYSWLNGHGTFVAGQILKRAPAAKLEIRGVLDGPNSTATVWEVAKAMASFLSIGIGILNLSVGCYTRDAQPPFVLERAVQVLASHGIVLLAAAGNHGNGTSVTIPRNAPIFPAACPGAIAVGALTDHGTEGLHRAPYSPTAEWVNLVAPGTSVVSTYLTGNVEFFRLPGLTVPPFAQKEFHGSASWTGTSFATAAVSGEIARLTIPGQTTPLQALNKLLERDPRGKGNDGIGKYLAEIPVCT